MLNVCVNINLVSSHSSPSPPFYAINIHPLSPISTRSAMIHPGIICNVGCLESHVRTRWLRVYSIYSTKKKNKHRATIYFI